MHELPLVFFTVIAQTAAGVWVLSYLAHFFQYPENSALTTSRVFKANMLAVILMMMGMALGLLHVGQPLRFINVLRGLGHAAMSLESVLSGAFLGVMLLWCLLVKFKAGLTFPFKYLHTLGGVIALFFAWSIINVYQVTTVRTGITYHTTLQMMLTSCILGGALVAVLGMKRIGLSVALLGIIISLVSKADYIYFITSVMPDIAVQQVQFWSAQILCLVLAIFLLLAERYSKYPCFALLLATLVLLIAELIGRIVFYNTWVVVM